MSNEPNYNLLIADPILRQIASLVGGRTAERWASSPFSPDPAERDYYERYLDEWITNPVVKEALRLIQMLDRHLRMFPTSAAPALAALGDGLVDPLVFVPFGPTSCFVDLDSIVGLRITATVVGHDGLEYAETTIQTSSRDLETIRISPGHAQNLLCRWLAWKQRSRKGEPNGKA